MGRNVEIKARIREIDAITRQVESVAGPCMERLLQEDTFFNVSKTRLKLRVFETGAGELIQYDRKNTLDPRESRYLRYPTTDPIALKHTLVNALGIRAIVRKKRSVYLCGQTRIHLDQVEGLGNFIELEVVLKSDEDFDHGVAIAQALMQQLDIRQDDLIGEAYVDLVGLART